jgi:hypothetical protein
MGSNKRPITIGNQNDTEPAPVYFTNPNSNLGQAPRASVLPSPLTATATVTSSWLDETGTASSASFRPSETERKIFNPLWNPSLPCAGTIETHCLRDDTGRQRGHLVDFVL